MILKRILVNLCVLISTTNYVFSMNDEIILDHTKIALIPAETMQQDSLAAAEEAPTVKSVSCSTQ